MAVWEPTEDTPIKELGRHSSYGVSQALADRLHEAGVTTCGKFVDLGTGVPSLKGFCYLERLTLANAYTIIEMIVNSKRAIKASRAALKNRNDGKQTGEPKP